MRPWGCTVRRMASEQRTIEPEHMAAMVKRCTKALGRRIADHDPYQLRHLVDVRRALDDVTRTTVQALRDEGYSWAEIAPGLGITRQAAQQAYSRKEAS
jgi:hypothetical protein